MQTAVISTAVVLIAATFALQSHPVGPKATELAGGNGPDAEVKEFRMAGLETRLQKMLPRPEHDYFAGILANREDQVTESIRLRN